MDRSGNDSIDTSDREQGAKGLGCAAREWHRCRQRGLRLCGVAVRCDPQQALSGGANSVPWSLRRLSCVPPRGCADTIAAAALKACRRCGTLFWLTVSSAVWALVGHFVFSSLKSNVCHAKPDESLSPSSKMAQDSRQTVPWPTTGCLSTREIYNLFLVLTIVLGGIPTALRGWGP
jgi:hypothetical protein